MSPRQSISSGPPLPGQVPGLTDGQVTFVERLTGDTGLDSGVIAAWCLAEESGGAAVSRQNAGNNNWLNIGYFDTGPGQIAFNSGFRDAASGADLTAKFLRGTWGGASVGIRAILGTASQSPSFQIAAIQKSGWASSGYPDLPSIYAGLGSSTRAGLKAGVTSGGVAGLGGTGTGSNAAASSPFMVGDTNNPSEDYWTACNRLSQARYWYFFSDGETIYLADGPDLMMQTPAVSGSGPGGALDRWGDAARIHSLSFTWDNTAFSFAVHHKKHAKVQRRSTLVKVQSPVEATMELVCDIDEVRAGDVILLSGCGPGDGKWLVGDCTRSVFQIYSSLTLVPALSPLSEQQVAGSNSSNGLTGALASAPGAGTVIAKMMSAAGTINNQDLPYVWAGGHAQVGTPSTGSPGPGFDGHSVGYDCSGAVAAVLKAGGLWAASTAPASNTIVDTLLGQRLVTNGTGSGKPECTLFDTSSHIFMRLDGEYFGTSDGAGHLPPTTRQGAGWIPNGGPGSGYRTTHFSRAELEKPA